MRYVLWGFLAQCVFDALVVYAIWRAAKRQDEIRDAVAAPSSSPGAYVQSDGGPGIPPK